ncbi:MAG TPA: holo-ACP synthase [Pyrinomonadaceae bacterium]
MIISIGIDIVEVERVRRTIERTPRFVERVFTQAERAYCDSRGTVAAQHYAARFAAKEATLKALGTGWSGGVAWHDVEVVAEETGAPALTLRSRALELFKQRGATHSHLSISHTSEHAIAQVVLERIDA